MSEKIIVSSPDECMFAEFEIHSKIFSCKNKDDYFMISSGTNQFSMPQLWKDSLKNEIESDYLYRWYTSSAGFQCATASLKIYEDFICSKGLFFPKDINNKVCMTIGGSGAASLVFDYLKNEFVQCNVVLVGMNYSLYERLGKKHSFSMEELHNKKNYYDLPSYDDFCSRESGRNKQVFVISNPNNPTGAIYSMEKFNRILEYIRSVNGFLILDQVCDLVITGKEYAFIETAITIQNMWDNTVIVNSFSKTDSTAGLRLGYLYGNERIINTVSDFQAGSFMNPPTFPVFAITLTCMFRCMYLNNQIVKRYTDEWIVRLFKRIYLVTSSIIPDKMMDFSEYVFKNYKEYYASYVSELLANENSIIINYKNTISELSAYIENYSRMEGGFNFCIWFKQRFKISEIELTRLLIEETGVAILTESAFTLHPLKNRRFFVRFSTACDKELYLSALRRMKECFEIKEVFE